MSFVSACFEIIGYIIFAPYLLGVSRLEAAVMGAVLSAVSPAVVVPRMVKLIENKYWYVSSSEKQTIRFPHIYLLNSESCGSVRLE